MPQELTGTYMTFTQSALLSKPGRSKCWRYQYEDGAVLGEIKVNLMLGEKRFDAYNERPYPALLNAAYHPRLANRMVMLRRNTSPLQLP